jgi:glutathione S-transferase
MLTVHGFARLNDKIASPSPFCLKLEIWLHLAGIEYKAVGDYNPMKAPKGKAPYVTMEDGRVLSDSSHIIETLAAEYRVTLDDHLNPKQRAQAVLIQRTVEEHLYFCILHDRWVRDPGFAILKVAYFGSAPLPFRLIVPGMARRGVKKASHLQGTSRHSDEEVWAAGVADIDALSIILGDDDYFGGDQPATVDAVVYGAIANVLWGPFPGPFQDAVSKRKNLVAWAERVHVRTFAV